MTDAGLGHLDAPVRLYCGGWRRRVCFIWSFLSLLLSDGQRLFISLPQMFPVCTAVLSLRCSDDRNPKCFDKTWTHGNITFFKPMIPSKFNVIAQMNQLLNQWAPESDRLTEIHSYKHKNKCHQCFSLLLLYYRTMLVCFNTGWISLFCLISLFLLIGRGLCRTGSFPTGQRQSHVQSTQ